MLREEGEAPPVAPANPATTCSGTTTKDMAQFTPPIGASRKKWLKKKKRITEECETFRGIPCFNIEDTAEFHSFAKGLKGFRYWRKHTQSEDIRLWANANYGKSFYVHNNGNYMLVNREKKVEESIDFELNELLNFNNKDEFVKTIKETINKIYDYYAHNQYDFFYAHMGALQRQYHNGLEFIDNDELRTFKNWKNDRAALRFIDTLFTSIKKGTI